MARNTRARLRNPLIAPPGAGVAVPFLVRIDAISELPDEAYFRRFVGLGWRGLNNCPGYVWSQKRARRKRTLV